MRPALLYLAHILGSAAGSIVTGLVLTDRLSLVAIAAALVVASLACVVMLAGTLPLPRSEKLLRASLAAGLALLALVAIPRWSAGVLADLQWKGAPNALSLVDIVENRSGIITVAADGTVFGNGMYDGRFNTDLKHDTNGIVRPYALSLFHPAPRDVLMIGLSSGSWAQVIANNPDVASLTVVEINPGYVTLIAKTPEVASLLTNPKVAIVTDDGRRWLRANPGRRFDAIVSNTNWHFRANVTNLLSAEFLRPRQKPPESARRILLQRHRIRPRPTYRLPGLRERSALPQSHGGVGDADPLGFRALAPHPCILPDRWPAGIRYLAQRRPRGTRPAAGKSGCRQRAAADRGLRGHPRPHRRRAAGDR